MHYCRSKEIFAIKIDETINKCNRFSHCVYLDSKEENRLLKEYKFVFRKQTYTIWKSVILFVSFLVESSTVWQQLNWQILTKKNHQKRRRSIRIAQIDDMKSIRSDIRSNSRYVMRRVTCTYTPRVIWTVLIIGAIAVIIRSSQLPRNEAAGFINIYPIHGRMVPS